MPDLLSCRIVCTDYPLNCCLGTSDVLCVVTNHKYVLLIIVIWLGSCSLLLGAFASNQYLASGLLLESFLIQTFRANKHANIVDSIVLWNENFFLDFRGVLESV